MAVNPPVNGRQTSVLSVCPGVTGVGVRRRWLPDQTQLDLFQSDRASPAGERERRPSSERRCHHVRRLLTPSSSSSSSCSVAVVTRAHRQLNRRRAAACLTNDLRQGSERHVACDVNASHLRRTRTRALPAITWRRAALSRCFQRVNNERNN